MRKLFLSVALALPALATGQEGVPFIKDNLLNSQILEQTRQPNGGVKSCVGIIAGQCIPLAKPVSSPRVALRPAAGLARRPTKPAKKKRSKPVTRAKRQADILSTPQGRSWGGKR